LREQLITRLRRWLLPYSAVYLADLSGLIRSWTLRVWLVLTMLLSLVALLDHSAPPDTSQRAAETRLAALLHPIAQSGGESHVLRELLKYYVVVWVSFVIVLTGGAISSELGVVADSVLSRGISRWQYFLGKWTARVTAVLVVYLVVMIPVTLVLWLSRTSEARDAPAVIAAVLETADAPAEMPANTINLGGACLGLAEVALVLAFVVSCGVALSATFGSTAISIGVGWVALYSSGVVLSVLNVSYFSPTQLLDQLPGVLRGQFALAEHCWILGVWSSLTLTIAAASGLAFARRDV
jgi:hypothetical protein